MKSLQQTLEQAHENEMQELRSACHNEGKAQTEQAVAELEAKLQEDHQRHIVGFSHDGDSEVYVTACS